MFIVAVTGGIATGKSTISKIFERNGVPVIDADKIAREIVKPGQPCWRKIREVFGNDVILPSKEINRAVLGRMVFENKELRGKLNQITHPPIHRKIIWEVFKYFISGHSWIVIDSPLLFETGMLIDFIHKIVTVYCEPEKQYQRLIKRNELSEKEAHNRIESQMPLDHKCEKSHFVINNNDSIENAEASATQIYNMMNDSKQHWYNRCVILCVVFTFFFLLYFLGNVFNWWTSIA